MLMKSDMKVPTMELIQRCLTRHLMTSRLVLVGGLILSLTPSMTGTVYASSKSKDREAKAKRIDDQIEENKEEISRLKKVNQEIDAGPAGEYASQYSGNCNICKTACTSAIYSDM